MNTYYLLTDVTTTDIFVAIVYGLLALIIGILFGYSINSKYRKKVVEFEQENVKLKSSVSNFEAQLEETKKARSNADDEITLLRNRVRDRDIRIKETEGKMALISKKLEESQAKASELDATKEIVLPSSKIAAPSLDQKAKEVKTEVKSKVTAPKLKKVKKEKDVKKKAKTSETKSKKSSTTSSTVTPTKSKKTASKAESKEAGKKKRGRPAGSKNKTTSTAKKVTAKKATPVKSATSIVAEPKRRGRPAGSKNKTTTSSAAKPAAKRGRPAGSTNKSTTTPTTTRRRGRPAGSKNKVAAASTGKRGRAKDNLTLIEGIGPKMEEALRNGGIKTFNKIAGTKPEKLKSILVKANSRFGIAATDSWPTQAKLAAKGAFEELKAYQDTLNRGR